MANLQPVEVAQHSSHPIMPRVAAPGSGRHRRRGRRDERTSAGDVAQQLDEIVERLQIARPYTLYRYLADQTGMHPTTVLRVHQGRLGTAHATLAKCVGRLLEQVRQGEPLPIGEGRPSGRELPLTQPGRVPTEQVQEAIEQVLAALGQDEHQFLYRYLAQRMAVHPTTVLRYHRGELRTAPSRLLSLLKDLHRRICAGEVVPFHRSTEGPEMVVRERVLEIVEALLAGANVDSKARLFRALDDHLNLKPGTMARIYYDHKLRFVRADIHRTLQRMVQSVEYDPCRVYAVGERLDHHLYGVGVVCEKVHKNKIRVEFHDGQQVLLSEAVPQDPFLHVRSAGWGTAHHAAMATDGLAH